MKKLVFACAFLAVASSEAWAEYVKARPGNEAAQAEAYCNMVARGSRQGFFAMGSQEFVAGAAIGNGIGNIIRQARTKQDCMTMMGYEWVKPKRNVQGVGKNAAKPGKSANRQKWNGNRNLSPERYKP
jgi:hypothetical protein